MLVVVCACGSPERTPTTTRATPTTPAADAGVAIEPAVADAAIAVSIDAPAVDAELAGAKPWVFRFYSTGMIVGKHRLETWTLRHHADRGMVHVVRAEGRGPGAGEVTPAGTTTYVGSLATAGKTLTFTLAAGNNKLALECKAEKLDVAGAAAVRKPHPRTGKYKEPCSGDPGRFVPPATKKVDVLSCKHPDFEAPMMFGAGPGVEYLHVNDDCDQQGGGYRAIGNDGALAPVR